MTQQDKIFAQFNEKFGIHKVKKINEDNVIDIYLPEIKTEKKSHLYINNSKNKIKFGFWGLDENVTNELLKKVSG